MAFAILSVMIGAAVARADANADCQRTIDTWVDIEIVIKGCTELLKADLSNPVAYYNRGVAHVRKSRNEDRRRAVADFDKAIELDPKLEAYMARGGLYLWFHDFDRAIDDFSEAIRLDPRSAAAYRKRGEAQQARGANWRAPASKRMITESDGEQLMQGWMEAQNKGLELAIADYTKALEIEPNDVDTLWSRGKAAAAKSDHDLVISGAR
jgi:tetratricopeptide (TPR) repeat protein